MYVLCIISCLFSYNGAGPVCFFAIIHYRVQQCHLSKKTKKKDHERPFSLAIIYNNPTCPLKASIMNCRA